jgi:hypothetical protein
MSMSKYASQADYWKAKYSELLNRKAELLNALRPFALWADSMYTLKDDDKVAGIYVRHFRDAAKVVNGEE